MIPFDYFTLALDIYTRNDLQQILKHANVLHGNTYSINKVITAIQTSRVGVLPQLSCKKGDLVEIKLCLNKNPIPQYINCPPPPPNTACPTNVNFV